MTEQQVGEFSLPTRPTKKTDIRAKGWQGDSVEVDAIPSRLLRSLVRNRIARHVDVAGDRTWFSNHPGAQRFVRPITPSEVIELRLVGRIPPGWDAAGNIEVVQIAPGLRTRRFSDTWIFPLREGAA